MSVKAKRTQKRDPAAILNNIWKDTVENPGGTIKFARDAENKFIWWVLICGIRNPKSETESGIRGPKDEFIGAEFLVKMEMDKNDPHTKPPKFWLKTPNCVYKLDERPCIGIGEYHSDDFLAGLGPRGFAYEIANGINSYPELGGGLNLVYGKYSPDQMQECARNSAKYNWEHNREIMQIMKIQYDKNLSKWLKKYPDDYKTPELAGKFRNEEVRRNAELSPTYLDELEWDPERA